jgi:hypothetical protein
MTDTMMDILCARSDRICTDGVKLLKEFSGMHPRNTPDSPFVLLGGNGDHSWNDLPPDGKQIQANLLPALDRLFELIRVLTKNLPNTVQNDLARTTRTIRNAIEQDGTTWWKTKDEAADEFRKLFDEFFITFASYSGGASGDVLIVPDTNALLANPDIEHWHLEGAGHFTVILTPTVLSELDKHKVNHRNQQVRDKASMLIQRIKEYRRRGPLHTGVPLVKNRISLRSIAGEPNMSQSLSWFDPTIADDRFLATALEIVRSNLNTAVFIVTSDVNMQNKTELAEIPFREVP